MHVLVVDDARAMRSILKKMLEEIGLEVTTVPGGREGLETLETSDLPDLMLVDWNMPEMSGIEFVRAVRADTKYDDIRIMMCTTVIRCNAQELLPASTRAKDVLTRDVVTSALFRRKCPVNLSPSSAQGSFTRILCFQRGDPRSNPG
ncbi:MAG: response regulator [Fuerstiella sp.]